MDTFPLDDLPDDVLRVIFDYLQESSLVLREVSLRWKLLVTKYKTGCILFPSRRYDNIIRLFTRSQFKVRIKKSEDIKQISLTDVSALGGVHSLYLSCTQVSDVSALGGVHTLYLSGTKVTDVSALGGVHALYLTDTEVTDVSVLGGVHSLYLSCTQVSDVSALGGVHTLYLRHTQVADVSALGGVHSLNLR
uniref:F-box domain protein n=1 Tax=Marseillevirus LCMAC101 TaxID=2506602 RepID=A0A481YRD6_9VIRU|nr:MAG: F-box domain protein [Marseillevirus LCMAC101]